MKVAVVGSNGRVGSLVVKELLERIKEDTTQISLLIDRDNEPSKCLALRAGFEKVCKDEYNYDKYQIKS